MTLGQNEARMHGPLGALFREPLEGAIRYTPLETGLRRRARCHWIERDGEAFCDCCHAPIGTGSPCGECDQVRRVLRAVRVNQARELLRQREVDDG